MDYRTSFTRLALLLLAMSSTAHTQSAYWQSLNGPFRNESRYYFRYADGERIYCGNSTGTYRSTDGGVTWLFLSSPPASSMSVKLGSNGNLYNIGVTPLLVSPDHGSFYLLSRSSDRGLHWDSLGATYNLQIAFGGGDTVYERGGRADIVYGATTVARSINGGANWTTLLTASGYNGYGEVYTQGSLLFVTKNVFTSVVVPITSCSSDGGTTWKDLIMSRRVESSTPSKFLALSPKWKTVGVDLQVAEDLNFSSNSGNSWSTVLTADSGFTSLISNSTGCLLVLSKPGFHVCRSTDAGATWSLGGEGPAGDPFASIRFFGNQNLVAITRGGVYYRSTDLGISWIAVLDMGGNLLTGTLQYSADSLLVVADATGNWIESTDGGGSFIARESQYPGAEVASLLMLPSGRLCAGNSTNLLIRESDGAWSSGGMSGPIWALAKGGSGTFFAGSGAHGISPMRFNGELSRIDESGLEMTHMLGGNTSYYVSTPDFYAVLCPGEDLILAGFGNRIARSSISVINWTFPKSSTGWFSSFAQDSAGWILAGNMGGGIFRSSDLGVSWTAANSGLANLSVRSIVTTRSGTVLAGTQSGGLFRSTDHGGTWTASGLSGAIVQGLAVDRWGNVYAGLAGWPYISTDEGESWAILNSGLPNSDIPCLTVGEDGSVYCGTWGAGVFKLTEPLPVAPHLISPVNGSTTLQWPIRLRWRSSSGSQGYRLQLSTSSSFIGRLSYDGSDIKDTSHAFLQLLEGSTYYWRVRGINREGEGAWSSTWSFTPDSRRPGVLECVSPVSGSTLAADSVRLTWRRGWPEVTKYWLDHSIDSTFTRATSDSTITDTTTVITNLMRGRRHWWRVRASNVAGWGEFCMPWNFSVPLTGLDDSRTAPIEFKLTQNYPNPFNPSTSIRFTIPVRTHVSLTVYSTIGQEVLALVNEEREAGYYETAVDGSALASGVYFYRLVAGTFVSTKKFVLLR